MRTLICVAVLVAVVAGQAMPDAAGAGGKFMEYVAECGGDAAKDLMKPGQKPNINKMMNIASEVCLPECVLKKYDAIDDKGQLVVDKIQEIEIMGRKPKQNKIASCEKKFKDEKDSCKRLKKTCMCFMRRGKGGN